MAGMHGQEPLNNTNAVHYVPLLFFQRELSSGSHRSSGGSSGSKGRSSNNLKPKDRVLSGGSGEWGNTVSSWVRELRRYKIETT